MNRLKMIRGGTGRLNVVSVPIYLAVIAAIYIGFKYLPLYWQREQLTEIAQNGLMSAHRYGDLHITTFIIDMAGEELGLDLTNDNVKVFRSRNRITAKIDYWVIVQHPFGYTTTHLFHINTTRRIFDY